MPAEIKVPSLGESVSEATVGKWLKKVGDVVKADEPLVELETDKVTLEVNAPSAGTLAEILVQPGSNIKVGGLLGRVTEGAVAAKPANQQPAAPAAAVPAPQKPMAVAPTPAAAASNFASALAAASTNA